MKVVPMKAERRTALGRNQVANLRAEGWMPAVVYGDGKESMSIAVSEWELDQHVKKHHKVFHLDIGGALESALLQEVSWHAVNDRPLHADFRRIDLKKPIETDIEVTLVGHPIGIGKGGTLVKDHIVLKVRCLPTELPDLVEHDVAKVDLDEFVTAGQIVLPTSVTLVSPANMTVCHVAKLVGPAEAAPAAAAVDVAAEAAPAGEKSEKPEKPDKKG